MRRNGRTDNNQNEIVAALKAIFATVQTLTNVGDGCPDLLVGFQGKNYLMEIKQNDKACKLSQGQVKWHAIWMGQVAVVRTPDEAVHIVTDKKYPLKDEQLILGGIKDEDDTKQFDTYLTSAKKAKHTKKRFWYRKRGVY